MTPRRTRILFHIPMLLLGGAERNLFHLASRLPRDLYEAVVWCSETDGIVGDWLREAGAPVHVAGFSMSDPERSAETVAWMQAQHADIYHSFGYRRDCRDVVAAVMAEIPVIATNRQSMRSWGPSGQMQEWERIRNHHTDAVIALSGNIADEAMAAEGFSPDKLHVIYSGVVVPPESATPVNDGVLKLGSVGNLRHAKRHDVMLAALTIVVKECPAVHLVICGKDYGLLEQLRQQCSDLGITDHVDFVTDCDDSAAVLRGLDIYVQSSDTEGLSVAVLEAMSHGLPVVATDAGGTNEAVEHGTTGLLVPTGDPAAIAQNLLTLIRDRQTRLEFGRAGRARVLERFSVESMVRNHVALYESLLRR